MDSVHIVIVRPDPLLWLVGYAAPLPVRVCTETVLEAGAGAVVITDTEIAPARGKVPFGRLTMPAAACYLRRDRAVEAAAQELIRFAADPVFRRCDLPDVWAALRFRFWGVVGGVVLSSEMVQSAREVGIR